MKASTYYSWSRWTPSIIASVMPSLMLAIGASLISAVFSFSSRSVTMLYIVGHFRTSKHSAMKKTPWKCTNIIEVALKSVNQRLGMMCWHGVLILWLPFLSQLGQMSCCQRYEFSLKFLCHTHSFDVLVLHMLTYKTKLLIQDMWSEDLLRWMTLLQFQLLKIKSSISCQSPWFICFRLPPVYFILSHPDSMLSLQLCSTFGV